MNAFAATTDWPWNVCAHSASRRRAVKIWGVINGWAHVCVCVRQNSHQFDWERDLMSIRECRQAESFAAKCCCACSEEHSRGKRAGGSQMRQPAFVYTHIHIAYVESKEAERTLTFWHPIFSDRTFYGNAAVCVWRSKSARLRVDDMCVYDCTMYTHTQSHKHMCGSGDRALIVNTLTHTAHRIALRLDARAPSTFRRVRKMCVCDCATR